MKYYTVEEIPHTLDNKITIFGANGVEEFNTTIPVNLVEGYCRCLDDLGHRNYFVCTTLN